MANNQIKKWLDETGLPVYQISHNRWQVKMNHSHVDYTVTVTNRDGWVSFGSELMGLTRSSKKDEFYKRILQLNATINGAHIAIDDERLVLIRDEFVEDIDKYDTYRCLELFHRAHESIYNQILVEAEKLGLSGTLEP